MVYEYSLIVLSIKHMQRVKKIRERTGRGRERGQWEGGGRGRKGEGGRKRERGGRRKSFGWGRRKGGGGGKKLTEIGRQTNRQKDREWISERNNKKVDNSPTVVRSLRTSTLWDRTKLTPENLHIMGQDETDP